MHLQALKPKFKLGHYIINELIGEGGFGLTYLATDKKHNRQVAIKEYLPCDCAIRNNDGSIIAKSDSAQLIFDQGLAAFINEAQTLAHFKHDCIVKIHDSFENNGSAYIIMEYCESGSLADKITNSISLPSQNIEEILTPIIQGLQKVHEKGILHMDIKPGNIMFRNDNTPVLIDFGAARMAIGHKTRHLKAIYTPGFAPLEQFSKDAKIGPWTDIYALAAVAYNCIIGKKPPSATNRIIKDQIEKISGINDTNFHRSIDKALCLHSDDRPQSLKKWLASWSSDYCESHESSVITELNLDD